MNEDVEVVVINKEEVEDMIRQMMEQISVIRDKLEEIEARIGQAPSEEASEEEEPMTGEEEDVTEEEIIKAIEEGFDDLESLKRYTGVTTGPCQGKSCLMHVIRILSQKTKKSVDEIGVTIQRQPVNPVPLYILARGEEM